MNKKLPVFWLAILSITAGQNLYAHEVNPDIEKRATEREEVKEQEDRKTWDDFMSAVNAQETEVDADKESAQNKPPSQ